MFVETESRKKKVLKIGTMLQRFCLLPFFCWKEKVRVRNTFQNFSQGNVKFDNDKRIENIRKKYILNFIKT